MEMKSIHIHIQIPLKVLAPGLTNMGTFLPFDKMYLNKLKI